MKIAFLERRRQRREAHARAVMEVENNEWLARVAWERQCDRANAERKAERAYKTAYPALRERFILAALTGLTAHPIVLTSESAWLGRMAVERAEAAMLEAGYGPPGAPK